MSDQRPHAGFGYFLAVVATSAVVLLRLALVGGPGENASLLPLVGAVLLAAWYGGLKPGLLASALGVVAGMYLFIAPLPNGWLQVLLFAVIGALISGVCESFHAGRRCLDREAGEGQRKAAELAAAHFRLEESFALLDTLLNSAPVGLAFVDPECRFLRVNPVLAAMNGPDEASHLGRTVAEIVPHLWPALEPTFRQVLEEGRPVLDVEVSGEVPAAPGRRRHWLVGCYPVRVGRGKLLGIGVVVADVTKERRAAEGLRRADRSKDDFLATLAHELRNPLAPLCNALQVMRLAGDDPGTVDRARDVMGRQLQQLVRLVDDMLDVSRIGHNKLELRKERVELAAVIQRAVESSRLVIEASNHELTVTLPPRQVFLNADLPRLTQVFLNLLTNAAKYTEPGGHIWLTAERQGSDLVVTVKDTGVGIAADMLPHIFEMFQQLDRSLHQSQGGLGIGLTLVRRLVEMHEGRVEAHSEGLGKGSEFVVRLPVIVEMPRVQEPVPSEYVEQTATPSRCRILVVDDDRDSATSMALLLQARGHEVRTAHDGLQGVDAAAVFRPDLVLMDIGLPRLNGHEAARRIRAQAWGKDMVLVALTGWGQAEDQRLSKEAGFDHHLVKPVDPAVLQMLLIEHGPPPAEVTASGDG
jgi:PAS domain S-box-containing protein